MDNNKKILSPARKLYLKETRRTSAWISFCKIFLIIGLLLLWEIAGSFGWIDPFIMSQPSRILHCIADLYKQGDLIKHIAVSCAETAVGFLLGTCIGTLIATLLWWSPFFFKSIGTLPGNSQRTSQGCFGAYYYRLGGSWSKSNYYYGSCHLVDCNHTGGISWFQ